MVDINTLTLEKYLAMTRDEQGSSLVRPVIGADVQFEIKAQFMRDLREKLFFGNKNEDTYEHVEYVLFITSLFYIPRVSHDVVMLRVLPMTLTRAARRWVDRLPGGTINMWNLPKKVHSTLLPSFQDGKTIGGDSQLQTRG